MGVTAPFPWVLEVTRFCCALQESVSPALWEFCNQITLASIVRFLGGSQSLCWIPKLGNLLWALELLQKCEKFFGIIVPQFVGHPLSGSIVELMATFSKRTHATCRVSQLCCSQSPCPCSRSLLTCASTGDALTLKGRSGSVFCDDHCYFPWVLVHTRFVCALWASLAGLRFDFKHDHVPSYCLVGASSLPLDVFFWWDPTVSC